MTMSSRFATLFLAPALLAGLACASPVRAADDGQAPIWTGIGGLIGLGPDKDDTPIEYREHGKLVLPPKMDLPQPGVAQPITNQAAWPVDPDVQRRIKAREAKKNTYFVPLSDKGHTQNRTYGETANGDSTVTVRPFAGQGPRTPQCATGSPASSCKSQGWSMLSMFNLTGQADSTAVGAEPDREWLTDPPKGYRSPVSASNATSNAAPK